MVSNMTTFDEIQEEAVRLLSLMQYEIQNPNLQFIVFQSVWIETARTR